MQCPMVLLICEDHFWTQYSSNCCTLPTFTQINTVINNIQFKQADLRITNCIPDNGNCKIICSTNINSERKVVLWFELHTFFTLIIFYFSCTHITLVLVLIDGWCTSCSRRIKHLFILQIIKHVILVMCIL